MYVYNGKYQMMPDNEPLDCACVIHSDGYSWDYVERLYSMLCRNLSRPVRLHVYTEASRTVPDHMVKHALTEWGFAGPKKSWWYKLQLFNTEHHSGQLLYFDLDIVITKNIDWIWKLPQRHFWAVRDFKYLWNNTCTVSNTSVMWWNTTAYQYVWKEVADSDINNFTSRYKGDQDLITSLIPIGNRKFFNTDWVKSWRWQCLDGGFNFTKRKHLRPNTGTTVSTDTSILVFHGTPKPHETQDPVILEHWQ